MGAVRTKTLAGLRRRRLQAFVIGTVLFLASAAATIALDSLVESQAPFDHAFEASNGAHIVIDYDGHVSASDLAATALTKGVTASSGPWPVAHIGFLINPGDAAKGGLPFFSLGEVSGRSDPATAVDRVTISAGRWWAVPGEIVVAQKWAELRGTRVGDTIDVQQTPPSGKGIEIPAPGSPPNASGSHLIVRSMKVVGIAGSISTPDTEAWVSPADIATLTPGYVPDWQMLYRVGPAPTAADLAAVTTAIGHDLPATAIGDGLSSTAIVSSQTYLTEKANVDRTASIFVPILLAFAAFALLAAAFIIANVVTGIVLGSYREIGVMKAVGYTPGQISAVLLAQILAPVTVGSLAGVVVGTVASQPILAQTARAFGLPAAFTLSAPVIAAVLGATVVIGALAALGPAARAGRLSAVGAITRGTTPSSNPAGGFLRSLALDLPLPTPVRLGFAAGVARPVRAAMTLGALVVGVAAVVFALGLDGSMQRVAADLIRDKASPIRVELFDRTYSPAKVTAAIATNPDTARYVSIGQVQVTVPQLGGPIPFIGYDGDSSWIGYALIHGRWFAGPGEAVAPTNFFTQSGRHLGDTVTATFQGRPMTLTLVGEIFDQARENRDDLLLRGEWSDLATVAPDIQPTTWEVLPRPGALPLALRSTLEDGTSRAVAVDVVEDSSTNEGFLIYEGVISTLGLVLVAISLGGVFNTVVLETRQRMRETAVLKAIGMTPPQVVGMVVASLVPVGVVAGLLGVPLGLAFQRIVLGFMGQAATKTDIPASALDVFAPGVLLLLGLAGLAIGVLGAYLPAQRAARSRIAPVLQAE